MPDPDRLYRYKESIQYKNSSIITDKGDNMYCKYCGVKLDGTGAFCTNCGKPVNDMLGNAGKPMRYNSGQRIYMASPKKKFPLLGMIAAIFIPLIIVMALLILFPGGFKFNKKQKESVAAGSGATALTAGETNASAETETASEVEPQDKSEEGEGLGNDSAKEHEFALEESSDTCLGGNAEVALVGWDRGESTITVRIYNNSSEEISTFGYPTLVIDGQSIPLDPYSNMSLGLTHIASDSYTDLVYHVDPSIFENGGRIEGQLHSMNPLLLPDNSYSLDVIIVEE